MKYYNIRNKSQRVTFREAVIQGTASDAGLFMPESFPVMDKAFLKNLHGLSLPEIAFVAGTEYIGSEIPAGILMDICYEAFNFPIEVKQLEERKYVLELFHGPTGAFKDYGARFMSRCFRYFTTADDKKTVILVATSGDTGGAIADSFHGIDNIEVVILYPSGRISPLQERQITSPGGNIRALETDGTFDDCQSLVKHALSHFVNHGRINLTSANSINIARLIPQSFYYYYAAGRIRSRECVIAVPSGNFGNLTAAMFAWKSGLPVENFIAATNINKVVPEYLASRVYTPRKAVATISNAMDVGNPNNFERMTELFGGDWSRMTSMVSGYWFTDAETKAHMSEVFLKRGYMLDPHGAVGSLGLDAYLGENQLSTGIFAATAHPAKFPETVKECTGIEIGVPVTMQHLQEREIKTSTKIRADYHDLEQVLSEIC